MARARPKLEFMTQLLLHNRAIWEPEGFHIGPQFYEPMWQLMRAQLTNAGFSVASRDRDRMGDLIWMIGGRRLSGVVSWPAKEHLCARFGLPYEPSEFG